MATTRTEQLELQVAREAALVEKLNDRFANEMRAVLKLANGRTREILRDLRAKDGRMVALKANLGRVLGLRRDIQRVLAEAGYADVVEAALDRPLDELARLVLRGNSIAQAAFSLSKADLGVLSAFKTIRFDELMKVEADTAIRLARVALDGTLGLQPVEHLVDDVAEEFDQSLKQARTTYDTAVSIYSRQVDQLHASGEPDELFYYAGPLDLKTRPFCRERVGKVFTRKELETADNKQLPNPLLTGGGYNCRHVAKRVSKLDQELIDLRKTGERAPHVQQFLDDLKRAA